MENIIGIYRIVSPSKKIYVGQSVDIMSRWKFYRRLACKKQTFLYYSLKKYGVDKHKFDILHRCTKEELNSLEKYYVDLYQCFNSENGLNLRDGGGSKGSLSKETKEKIRNSKLGLPSYIRTESQKMIARENRLGFIVKNETKEKLRKYNLGKKYSDETNKKKGTSRYGADNPFYGKSSKNRKPVSIVDLKGSIIQTFDSLQAASDFTNIGRSHIRMVCNGKYKMAKGIIFKFS